MKYIVVYIVLLVAIPFVHGAYYSVNGTQYFISYPMMKNWHQAQRYCRIQGMHLLMINTPDENDLVLDVIKRFNATSPHIHFWTSGTDAGHADKEWYWAETGLPVLFTNWLEGAPSSTERDCILLHGGAHNFRFYDQYCRELHHFICQDRLTGPDTLKHQRCQSDV